MATALATIILAIAAPVMMWKNHSLERDYNEYKDYNEARTKLASVIGGAPPRIITIDQRTRRVVSRVDNKDVTYTVDPSLQKYAEQALMKNDPYAGSIVAINPANGAVIAMASYTNRRRAFYESNPFSSMTDIVSRNSVYPMASIQKIITAAAALDTGTAKPDRTTDCNGFFKAGDTLIPCSRGQGRGHGRITLGHAMATSCNVTYAALALDVKRETLEEYYRRFMFNKRIDFDMPLAESVLTIAPGNGGLARAGCGLDGARVSPVHAALVAAAVQNGGVMMRPFIVESVSSENKEIYRTKPEQIARPITKKTAAELAETLSSTVEEGGTGYRKFGRTLGNGKDKLKVMAKTGSLNDNGPGEHYTWFVGFVDEGAPRMAFAIMMMSDESHTEMHAVNLARDFFLAIINDPKNKAYDR